jgi:hypothetical protein
VADLVLTTRHDKASVKVGATPIEVRANGAKVYEGTAAFGDIVKRYPDLDPPRNEFIPAEEAMSVAALASLRGAIFTAGPRARDWDGRLTLPADHPPELSTPDTAGDLLEGVVLEARRYDPPGGGFPELKVQVIAHTRAMQELIESGTCRLSLGMTAAEDWTPGVGPRCGTPYDCVQRSVTYDHLNVVDAARSRTPDGRQARLDAADRDDPAAPPSYPRPGESPIMNPEVLALLAKHMKMDALSAEDAALLAQMSPEAQKRFAAIAAGAAEGAAAAAEGAPAEVPADFAGIAAMLKTLAADVAALKSARSDAPPPAADPAVDKAKKDAEALLRATGIDANATRQDSAMLSDPAAVIAAATKAASSAAVKSYNDAAAFVGHVRKDGHPANTTDEAATVMLATIAEHLPILKPVAEVHVKAQRLDALKPLYDQAEKIRRDSLMRQQGEDIADIVNPRNDADGTDSQATTPFLMPTRPERRARS